MLTCLLKRVLPFLLTLTFGAAVGNIFRPATPAARNYKAVLVATNHKSCSHRFQSYGSSPLVINDVPDVSMKDAVRLSGIFTSTQKFQVLLGSDGRVWDVSPTTDTRSFDSTQSISAVVKREVATWESLKGLAMDAARQIEFAPATVNGEPTSTWVTVAYEFSNHPTPDCPKCSTTSVTVTEDGNTLWHREAHGD
ncbi:MAG: hypothetical protein WCB68_17715 [Pyrinomonadaceae bacterium]